MATAVMPRRSLEQRMAALDEANRIRTYRAGVKRDVRAGRKRLAELLADPDLDTMRVWDLLICLPKMGRVKVSRLHSRLAISPSKTIGGLSERQKTALLEALS